ncbi:alpha/beta fold hydrolase [Paenibacillus sp. N4]|uniref:alpha/beta hydrolase n=1 Tax=Paenibacillus vietnamensis TaxID=2590547 RepID=UPI001CD11C19|nr:alpha/beta fold hydrolase [Paenibacillus vietnamensis]MCA0755855.1 alpha/beta fold hydrolase [Paenibacillus vietnamensis]
MSFVSWLAAGSAGIVGALTAFVWKIGAKSQQPRVVANAEVPEVEADWREVLFTSSGSVMKGWLLLPRFGADSREPEKLLPAVVVAHGWGSNRTRVLRYAHPLYKAGYAIFMYDARSHGESGAIKAPSALMFRDDVLAAVAAARGIGGIDPERVSVLGHSLGGFGSLLALDHGLKVRSVITDSMPVRFETMMEAELKRKKMPFFPLAYLIPQIWLWRAGITRKQFRAANIPEVLGRRAGSARDGRTPVLMIHSDGDDYIPAADLHRLKEQLPAKSVTTLFVSTPGHSSSERDPAFWDRVLPFLEKTLRV